MSFNGSGTFNINTAGQPVVTGTTISSTAFNALTADLATGLTDCVTRDGQSPATANIPLGNNKITGLANGTVATDAAAFGQLSTFGVPGYTTTATAAGTTTLTVASTTNQFFTGITTQTVVLPVTSTLVLGFRFRIVNNSTGIVTVNSSGSNLVASIPGSTEVTLTCILTSGTTAASWDLKFAGVTTETGTGGLVRDTSAAMTTPTITSATLVTPALGTPASGALTNCTSIPGAQINAGTIATAAIADANVTLAKMADLAADTVIGRADGAGTGVPTALSATQLATILATVAGVFKSKVVTFSRDLSTATGSQAVTGVGFVPKTIILFGAVGGTAQFQGAGFADSAKGGASISQFGSGAPAMTTNGSLIFIGTNAGTTFQIADISTYDSDGFTLSWTKTGSPTGTATFYALCLR